MIDFSLFMNSGLKPSNRNYTIIQLLILNSTQTEKSWKSCKTTARLNHHYNQNKQLGTFSRIKFGKKSLFDAEILNKKKIQNEFFSTLSEIKLKFQKQLNSQRNLKQRIVKCIFIKFLRDDTFWLTVFFKSKSKDKINKND